MTSEALISLRLGWHVVVRNWTVYRKDFLANISPTLADPALMMTALGMGLSPFIGQIEGLTYAHYLAPGMVATTALFTAFFDSSYGFYVRMTFESIFKAMLTTPIGVREIVIGEFLWSFIRAAMMGGVVGLVLAVMGLLPNPWAVLVFPFIAGLLSVPCGAIGLLAAARVRNINQFQTVYSFLIAPIYFLSGVFFPLGDRPILSVIVQFSPFYHGVRLLQMNAWGRWDTNQILLHTAALVAFTLVLGVWSYRSIRRKLTN
jgi:lipooligosaccharide transport system permease protein